MKRLITSVTVHYKNGEKQTLALVKSGSDFVIAPYFKSVTEGWDGSGFYVLDRGERFTAVDALKEFYNRVENEKNSVFVDNITF